MLETHQEIVAQHAEALSREIALLIFAGRYDEAIRLMTGRRFEVWEGGSLSVAADWTSAHILRGRRHRAAGRFPEALADFAAAGQVPDNLPSDEGSGDHRAEIAYAIGLVHEAMGNREAARKSWQEAASLDAPGPGRGRNQGLSNRSVQRYYQGLAMRKLGRAGDAEAIFRELLESARAPSRARRPRSRTRRPSLPARHTETAWHSLTSSPVSATSAWGKRIKPGIR